LVFDAGETLVKETTKYHAHADWLGVDEQRVMPRGVSG
jgi:hypothetical protein